MYVSMCNSSIQGLKLPTVVCYFIADYCIIDSWVFDVINLGI